MKRHVHILLGPTARPETFLCEHCKRQVSAVAPGARHRSHCPHCLWSLHVGAVADRPAANCRGQMEPVAVSTHAGGAWSLVHRCRQCAATLVHTVAADDNGAALLTIGTRTPRQPGRKELVR